MWTRWRPFPPPFLVFVVTECRISNWLCRIFVLMKQRHQSLWTRIIGARKNWLNILNEPVLTGLIISNVIINTKKLCLSLSLCVCAHRNISLENKSLLHWAFCLDMTETQINTVPLNKFYNVTIVRQRNACK